jgi:hypothetical protein
MRLPEVPATVDLRRVQWAKRPTSCRTRGAVRTVAAWCPSAISQAVDGPGGTLPWDRGESGAYKHTE